MTKDVLLKVCGLILFLRAGLSLNKTFIMKASLERVGVGRWFWRWGAVVSRSFYSHRPRN